MPTLLAAALATQLSLMPTNAPPRWTLIDQTLEGFGSDGAAEPFAMRTMLVQALASVGGAVLLGVGGTAAGSALGRAVGEPGSYSGLVYGIVGGGIGAPLGFILGIWLPGRMFGHSGSLMATLGVSLSGAFLALILVEPLPALSILLVPGTLAAAIAVYHLTDKAFRPYAAVTRPSARPEERQVAEVKRPSTSLLRVAF